MVRPGYKQTEVGVIPEDWEVVPIGQMFTFKNGLNKAKQFFGYGTPIVNYMDVFSRPGLRLGDVAGRVDVNSRELASYEVRKGDVFFTRTSETVEEIGVASVMLDEPQKTVFSGFVLRARPSDESLDDEFKAYCFTPRYFRQQVTSRASYTTRALTNGRSLSAALLARPPLSEQRAIAAALSDVDAALAGVLRLIAKKKDLKQAAMQTLITGQTRLPGFSGDWEVKRLGDCLDIRPSYGINAAAVPFSDQLPAYIRITDIDPDGYFSPNPLVSVNTDSTKYDLAPGDLVFARTGASVGKSYLYDSKDGRLVFAGFLIRVRPDVTKLFPRFLAEYAKTDRYWNWVTLMSMRSGQPGINGQEYEQLPLLLPAIEEQTAIASVLSDMDAEIAALQDRADKTRLLKQAMMQDLLTGRVRLPLSEVTDA